MVGLGMFVHGSEDTLLQAPTRDRVYGLEAAIVLKKNQRG